MYSKFETVLKVRPSDIDYNGHVHQSVYLDYLLFARVDQMERFYKMSMQEFFERGYTWATKSVTIEFKKSFFMTERVTIRTWVDDIRRQSVKVGFQFLKNSGETAAEGHSVFVLINAKTGKPEPIPEDIIHKYSI
ncbi:MAG: acyl-CoA thioesterase [Candidatus Aminicenantes bacterium]|nr:acyl-CoA thioesterase [Candidatus Aminicenantes bacterium]